MEHINRQIKLNNYDETMNFGNVLTLEDELCSAVSSGNITLLETCITKSTLNPINTIINTESIQLDRYSFVVLLSLILRSAIHGGLPQFVAFSLSISYCQRVEELKTNEEIRELTRMMLREYCEQVNAANVGRSNSHVVKMCQIYIHEHLHENISMNDLSTYCRVSTRSISAHFKKELNMSVPAYITKEKLSEAKYLLSYSNYTISEISNYLSFSSQSYFTKVFKNAFDCTPQQYRDGAAPLA